LALVQVLPSVQALALALALALARLASVLVQLLLRD